MVDRGWNYYPSLRLALPCAAGILAAHLLVPSVAQLLVLLSAALGWLALSSWRGRPFLALPFLLVAFAAGALWYTVRADAPDTGLQGARIEDAELIGRVIGDPVYRQNRIEFLMECDSLLYRNSSVRPATHILVRLYDRSPFNPALLPGYGSRITLVGTAMVPAASANPGEFDYAAYLRSRGIGLVVNVGRASAIYQFGACQLGVLERIVLTVRRAARNFCDSHVGGEGGDILRALIFGERDYIDPETRQAFTITGTVHVLAVSGCNVGLIALVLFVAVSWIGNRLWQLLVFIPALVLYTAVAGGEASILRATVMASAFLVARVAGRIPRPLNTLGVAALVILLLDPRQLFDVGFQLSFASVAGILMVYVPLWEWLLARVRVLHRFSPLRWLAAMLLLTVSAQLFTLPFVLYHFGFISFISLLLNIPVVPLTSAALGAGMAGIVADLFSGTLASWFGGGAHLALCATEWLVSRGAALPGVGAEIGTIGLPGATLLMMMIFRLAMGAHPMQIAVRLGACICAFASIVVFDRMADPLSRNNGPYLYLLKGRDGVIAATVRGDSVLLYAAGRSADTTMLQHSGEALRRRCGATWVRAISLDSIRSVIACDDLLIVGARPPEVVLSDLPVLLSGTGRRRLGLVQAAGEQFLQVPLRMELEEAVVFRYDGAWHTVRWR